MSGLIISQPEICIKTGVRWTSNLDDWAHTGDLFYNVLTREWLIKGIPMNLESLSHIFTLNGPHEIDIKVLNPSVTKRFNQPYADGICGHIICSEKFMVWIEEWAFNIEAVCNAHKSWTFVENLYWTRSTI